MKAESRITPRPPIVASLRLSVAVTVLTVHADERGTTPFDSDAIGPRHAVRRVSPSVGERLGLTQDRKWIEFSDGLVRH
jgi:hypothetical protein